MAPFLPASCTAGSDVKDALDTIWPAPPFSVSKGNAMSGTETLKIAQAFLQAIGSGAEPDTVLAMFAEDVAFEIPGDADAFPWVGRFKGRAAVGRLLDGLQRLLIPEQFDVQDIVTGEVRAVILGKLGSRVIATGKLISSPFAIVLTVTAGTISGFLMLEDSFAVSAAAKS